METLFVVIVVGFAYLLGRENGRKSIAIETAREKRQLEIRYTRGTPVHLEYREIMELLRSTSAGSERIAAIDVELQAAIDDDNHARYF